jgi:hypothetical protein
VAINWLSGTTLGVGAVLWLITLVGVVRGRGMTRRQRWISVVLLAAAPIGAVLILR